MNMTISLTNSDICGKQKKSFREFVDAESEIEDFAALFSAPLMLPPINTPVKIAKPENSGETEVSVLFAQPNQSLSEKENQDQNSFEKDNPIDPVLLQKTNDLQMQNLTQPSGKTFSDTKLPEASLIPENLPQANSAEEVFNQNSIVTKDWETTVMSNNLKNFDFISTPYQATPLLSRKMFLSQTEEANTQISYFSSVLSREETSNNVPKLVGKISNVVKADNFVKANLAPNFTNEQKIVEQIKLMNISGESEQSSNQPETESLKTGKEIKGLENSSGQILDNFQNRLSSEQKIIESTPQLDNLSGKVFEQVEPPILELAALTQIGNEKRILKMRLNPVELGAVEITLEKSASGKINAYFQTESETTRQVLNESIVQLRNSLENAGWQVGDLEISCNSFSSNGEERRENQSRQFGTAENQIIAEPIFDGNSKGEDDAQSRLVSLRA